MDYKFNVGDKVITTDGRVGEIVDICDCEACRRRGYLEPTWVVYGDLDPNYITITDAQLDFHTFYKIGDYRFADFEKGEVLRDMAYHEDELKKLRKQLRTIEEIENGSLDY